MLTLIVGYLVTKDKIESDLLAIAIVCDAVLCATIIACVVVMVDK